MRTQDPRDDFQDGIDPAVTPPQAADGGLELAPIRQALPPRPRLCDAGPCKNYHRVAVQMDAANPYTRRLPIVLPEGTPGARVTPDGTTYTSPGTYHVQVSHYCYPTSGVEMILGDLPVTECTPVSMAPADFLKTAPGQLYQAEVRSWNAARAQEAAEADEAERLIAESMKIHESKETP
jgi:hypothetical protein